MWARPRGLLTAGGDNRAELADLMRQWRQRSAQSVLDYCSATIKMDVSDNQDG
jgi:hypothetical protein